MSKADAPESLQPKYQYVWSLRYIDAPLIRWENTDSDGLCDDLWLWYLTDANHNVTAIQRGASIVERYTYTPYGSPTVYNGAWTVQSGTQYDNVYQYTGREHDPETGFYYNRYRYYHAELGRFVNRDPIAYLGGDANLYGYVWSGPTQYVDPLGLEPQPPDSVQDHRLQIGPDYQSGSSRPQWSRPRPATKPEPPFPGRPGWVSPVVPMDDGYWFAPKGGGGKADALSKYENFFGAGGKWQLIPDGTPLSRAPIPAGPVPVRFVGGGESRFAKLNKQKLYFGVYGCATCVGVVIHCPGEGAAAFHFQTDAKPSNHIGKYDWPDNCTAAICGGMSTDATSNALYDRVIEALKNEGIPIDGVINDSGLFVCGAGWCAANFPAPSP